MKAKATLRRQITWRFAMLGLLIGLFFTLVSYISVEIIEFQVINDRLEKIAVQLIQQYRKGKELEVPPEINFYANQDIPLQFARDEPGMREVNFEGQQVQAMVVADGDDRFVILQDLDQFEQVEYITYAALGAGAFASMLLGVLLGVTTARRAVAPVTRLAEAVEQDVAPAELPGLQNQDEIGLLARAFAHRAEELQQYLARERLFTGDVSHELRTPLTILLGAAEVLTMRLAKQPEALKVAERMRRVAADASAKVSALLLLSRSPQLVGAPEIDLQPLLAAELERYQYLLEGKAVDCRLQCPQPVWVRARPELAGIVIGNLLRNACQYTEEGTILVRLTRHQLEVEDSGPGIPDVVRERLFERFVHGNADTATGAGLGLSIVKRVADHLGWKIGLQSRPQGGSRFTLHFPA